MRGGGGGDRKAPAGEATGPDQQGFTESHREPDAATLVLFQDRKRSGGNCKKISLNYQTIILKIK